MKQLSMLVFLSTLLLLTAVAFGMGEDDRPDTIVTSAAQEDSDAADIEALPVPSMDSRIKQIEDDAADEIAIMLEEINLIDDRGLEPELQKEIEKIKLDALIARYKIIMEISEEREDYDIVDILDQEIYRLKNPEERLSSGSSEQDAHAGTMEKEEK